MLKVRKNQLFKMFEQKKKLQQLEKAKQKFEFKTFSEQYSSMYSAINYGRVLFHLFSILTAFTFLYLLLDSFIHQSIVSGLLSAAILIFWEYVKSTVLENSFYSYYRGGLNFALVAIAFIMLSGSVFTSLNGAKTYAELNNTSVQNFKADSQAKIDSINTYYSEKIAAVKNELSEFKKSVSYHGKINVYNKTVQQTISRYNEEINALNRGADFQILELSKDNSHDLKEVEHKAEFNLLAFVVLSAINEFLIVVCAWFLVFFQFKLVQDSEVLEPVETYELDTNSINRLIQLATNTAQPQYLITNEDKQQKQVGFQVGTKQVLKQVSTDGNDDLSEVPNDIITAIKSGIKDPRYLMKTYKMNVIQVNKFLKEYS